MTGQEIAGMIAKLTDEQRDEIYGLCEARRRKYRNGADVAVYETVSPDIAEALHQQNLVWLIGSMLAAARHD